MFGYAVKHHGKKAQMDAHNAASLTALTLASKLGRHGIFKEIIEFQSFVSKPFNKLQLIVFEFMTWLFREVEEMTESQPSKMQRHRLFM